MEHTENLAKYQFLNGSHLKLIAVITMLIDHTALILLPCLPVLQIPLFAEYTVYAVLRKIGRLAFPLFCFLLAEGFYYTKNRLHYGRNLLIFALISELPYNLMKSGRLFYPNAQNIYFTLLLGFCILWLLNSPWKLYWKLPILVLIILFSPYLRAGYGRDGILLIVLLYALREKRLVSSLLALPLLSGGIAAWAAFVPIGMYNGKRGFISGKWLKYAFYIFYPVHILLLYGVRLLLAR